MDVKPPDPLELQSWLEWAGERVTAMYVSGTKPSSYRSFWPDYPSDPFTAYGYSNTKIRPPIPGSRDIELMDEIFNLVLLIPDPLRRRVLNSRALIHPLNGRHLFSWAKIAAVIDDSYWNVKLYHKEGLSILSRKIPSPAAAKIRLSINGHTRGPSLFP